MSEKEKGNQKTKERKKYERKNRRERRCQILPTLSHKEHEGKHVLITFRCLHAQEAI